MSSYALKHPIQYQLFKLHDENGFKNRKKNKQTIPDYIITFLIIEIQNSSHLTSRLLD